MSTGLDDCKNDLIFAIHAYALLKAITFTERNILRLLFSIRYVHVW